MKQINFTDLDISPFIEDNELNMDKLVEYLNDKTIMFMNLPCKYEDILFADGYYEILIRYTVNSVHYVISRSYRC